jgi:hypothetical protein
MIRLIYSPEAVEAIFQQLFSGPGELKLRMLSFFIPIRTRQSIAVLWISSDRFDSPAAI